MEYLLKPIKDSWNSDINDLFKVTVDDKNINVFIDAEKILMINKVELSHVLDGTVTYKCGNITIYVDSTTVLMEFYQNDMDGNYGVRELSFNKVELWHILNSPV